MRRSLLERLHAKLFLAIFATNAVLALAAYLVFSTSFDRGLVESLQRADGLRLQAFAASLAERHQREGSWRWIANDPERWALLSRQALGLPVRAPGAAASASPAPGARELPLTLESRLLLLDADRKLLLGRPESAIQAQTVPIQHGAAPVGYLGYVPRTHRVESIERFFLERQRATFALLAFGMLVAALALSAGLAWWLTRRIRALAHAAGALAEGRYDVRVPAAGADEFSQLAGDFNMLAATLEATRTARQQWIADIAHELRTPLSVLRGEIEALQDGVRAPEPEALASLALESARLARLVEDLHTLSLSDLGALSYRREALAVDSPIRDAAEARRRDLDEKGLALELSLEPGLRVLGDEARLGQVFANLMENSLRYTDAPGRISVRAGRAQGHVAIDWEDSAPGVPAAELPRLTERLYRVEHSRSRAGGGSGLGLAIVKAIVEAHGGTIGAEASPLGGLRIGIRLPLLNGARANG